MSQSLPTVKSVLSMKLFLLRSYFWPRNHFCAGVSCSGRSIFDGVASDSEVASDGDDILRGKVSFGIGNVHGGGTVLAAKPILITKSLLAVKPV